MGIPPNHPKFEDFTAVFLRYLIFSRNLHMGVSENREPKNPPDHLFIFLIPSTK